MSTANVASSSAAAGAGGSGGGVGGGGGSGGGGGGGGPCGACKFLRRKCVAGCIFAPYFDSEQGAAHFAAVHKVFGASNVSKLLLHIPPNKRLDAVVTICYEAQARLRDPIYGCVAHIFALQQQIIMSESPHSVAFSRRQVSVEVVLSVGFASFDKELPNFKRVVNLQAELSYLQSHLAALELPTPPPVPPQPLFVPPAQSISDLPVMPAAYELSALFDSVVHPSWTLHQRQQQIDPRQFPTTAAARAPPELQPSPAAVGGGGDLQELALELLNRHAPPTMPCRNQISALPPHSR
ncbi:hypothetical protein DH2020_002320 [Rehmannia glutinosa]|uniref:LOB domain-containing protein n=1 Tax=Rehmannia glutinosa TaxID=99300 RepID=A0ABR0XU29_REHGL